MSPSAACHGLGLLPAFLDHDDRPTFILDAHKLSYQNTALHDFVRRLSSANSVQQFDEWAARFDFGPDAAPITFGGRQWTSFLLEQRWTIVRVSDDGRHSTTKRANALERQSDTVLPCFSAEELRRKAGLSESTSDGSEDGIYELEVHQKSSDPHGSPISLSLPCLDWLRNPPQTLSDYFHFFLHHHWAATPLGPIKAWPDLLRQTVITILSCPDPRLLLWGSNMCLVYNEACLALIGQKHPAALGFGPAKVFSELWKPLKSIIKLAMQQGRATKVQDMQLAISRDPSLGLEETYCKCIPHILLCAATTLHGTNRCSSPLSQSTRCNSL